jgi:hypothetical protein
MSLYLGFMFDCHLFSDVTRTTENNEAAAIARYVRLFVEDGSGMAFARWGNHSVVPPLHGRKLDDGRWGVPYEEIKAWVRSALAYRPPLVDPGAA